jgi:hypothetical protein
MPATNTYALDPAIFLVVGCDGAREFAGAVLTVVKEPILRRF